MNIHPSRGVESFSKKNGEKKIQKKIVLPDCFLFEPQEISMKRQQDKIKKIYSSIMKK
jgi:hypothetical protein